MKTHLLSIIIMATSVPAVASSPYQDLDALDARVAAALPQGAGPVPIDRRIKLAACPQEPDISGPLAGAVSVRCPSLGWRLRVAVNGASAPSGASVQPVVHRGDAVELVSRGAGYSVTSVGTALEEGPAGGSIRVKIPTSPFPVAAVVARAGVASISN